MTKYPTTDACCTRLGWIEYNPTTDACCTRLGWTEYLATSDAFDLHISAAPDANIDGTFAAFDHDEQTMIRINGWLFSFERVAA